MNIRCASPPLRPSGKFVPCGTGADRMLPGQSAGVRLKFYAFCKRPRRRRCSLLAPKENQKGRRYPEGMKAPVGLLSRRPVCGANAACSAQQGHSDFDALDPTGCGPLRLLRALGGTRILQAAAPTAPPCIRRWRRSSPLQTRGCSPLSTPKRMAPYKKASRFAKRFFLVSPI